MREGDMPRARKLYYGPLQDALNMDPLFTLQSMINKAKTPKQKDFYMSLRNILQRGNTRFVMDTNKIAVLHK
eukprot:13423-Eustigmatos_ZCMA.PRE.1